MLAAAPGRRAGRRAVRPRGPPRQAARGVRGPPYAGARPDPAALRAPCRPARCPTTWCRPRSSLLDRLPLTRQRQARPRRPARARLRRRSPPAGRPATDAREGAVRGLRRGPRPADGSASTTTSSPSAATASSRCSSSAGPAPPGCGSPRARSSATARWPGSRPSRPPPAPAGARRSTTAPASVPLTPVMHWLRELRRPDRRLQPVGPGADARRAGRGRGSRPRCRPSPTGTTCCGPGWSADRATGALEVPPPARSTPTRGSSRVDVARTRTRRSLRDGGRRAGRTPPRPALDPDAGVMVRAVWFDAGRRARAGCC